MDSALEGLVREDCVEDVAGDGDDPAAVLDLTAPVDAVGAVLRALSRLEGVYANEDDELAAALDEMVLDALVVAADALFVGLFELGDTYRLLR